MERSESSPTLVLLALNEHDAVEWKRDNPELAEHVVVVTVASARNWFPGRDISALIYTEHATHDYRIDKAIAWAKYRIDRTKALPGFVKAAADFGVADVAPYLDAHRSAVRALVATAEASVVTRRNG